MRDLDGDGHKISVRIRRYLWEKEERNDVLEGSCSPDGRTAEKQQNGDEQEYGGGFTVKGCHWSALTAGQLISMYAPVQSSSFRLAMRGRDVKQNARTRRKIHCFSLISLRAAKTTRCNAAQHGPRRLRPQPQLQYVAPGVIDEIDRVRDVPPEEHVGHFVADVNERDNSARVHHHLRFEEKEGGKHGPAVVKEHGNCDNKQMVTVIEPFEVLAAEVRQGKQANNCKDRPTQEPGVEAANCALALYQVGRHYLSLAPRRTK